MNPRSRAASDVTARRNQIERLYLQGVSQTGIAGSLGSSIECVASELAVIRSRWQRSPERSVSPAKAHELAKIDHLEAEAWKAWERSQKHAETTKIITDPHKPEHERVTRAEKIIKGQAGDPRYLDRVCWCIERRCRLLGLEAPVKFAQTGSDGNDVYPRQARSEFYALLAVLRERSGTAPPAPNHGGPDADGALNPPG